MRTTMLFQLPSPMILKHLYLIKYKDVLSGRLWVSKVLGFESYIKLQYVFLNGRV